MQTLAKLGKSTLAPQNRPLRVLFMASSPTDVSFVLSFEAEEALILEKTAKAGLEVSR